MEEWSVTFVSEGGANTLHTKKKPEKKPSNPDDRSGPDSGPDLSSGLLGFANRKKAGKKKAGKNK